MTNEALLDAMVEIAAPDGDQPLQAMKVLDEEAACWRELRKSGLLPENEVQRIVEAVRQHKFAQPLHRIVKIK